MGELGRSGLLQGVAVGVNCGVPSVDGVAALIPLSASILAKQGAVDTVDVELRRDRGVTGVEQTELILLDVVLI